MAKKLETFQNKQADLRGERNFKGKKYNIKTRNSIDRVKQLLETTKDHVN